MKSYSLKIECNSAVCPSSGESWGGVIDSDVVYDDIGIPFIPAKRLKGLLLESAIDVCQAMQKVAKEDRKEHWTTENLFDLFGLAGSNRSAPIIMDDAQLKNYNETRIWLQWAQKNLRDLASPMQVLSLFTEFRAQTAIASDHQQVLENEIADEFLSKVQNNTDKTEDQALPAAGVAKPHSLRVQRVLRSGLVFESDIRIIREKSDRGMDYKSLLTLAAAATRHMGLQRNRGLGEIEMILMETNNPVDVDAILAEEVLHVG